MLLCLLWLIQCVMLSQQARLHMAWGALTYNSPSCLSAVVWPTFIKTNTAICFVLHFHENGKKHTKNKTALGGRVCVCVFLIVVVVVERVEELVNTLNRLQRL